MLDFGLQQQLHDVEIVAKLLENDFLDLCVVHIDFILDAFLS